jgi:hypothetical protein
LSNAVIDPSELPWAKNVPFNGDDAFANDLSSPTINRRR